jgi:hypothetical protein
VTTSSPTQRSKSRPARASGPSARVPSRRTSSRTGGRRRGTQSQSRRVGLAGGWIQRRQPKKSGVQKLIGGVSSVLPGTASGRTKTTASGGKAKRGGAIGGLALLAAAAGVAVKHRDKITAKLSSDPPNRAQGSAASQTTESAAEAGVADVSPPSLAGTSARDTEPSRTPAIPETPGSDTGPAA